MRYIRVVRRSDKTGTLTLNRLSVNTDLIASMAGWVVVPGFGFIMTG